MHLHNIHTRTTPALADSSPYHTHSPRYHYWLRCYAQLLARHGLEADLRALFNAMLEGRRFGGGSLRSPFGGSGATGASDGGARTTTDGAAGASSGGAGASSGAAGASSGGASASSGGAGATAADSKQLKRMLVAVGETNRALQRFVAEYVRNITPL